MEAALRTILKDSLGEYVKGRSLEKTDISSFPLVLRDLQLNEKKVQSEFDEFNESAIQLTCGKIGTITVTPSWMGTVDVVATNIELTFSFSPTQALKNQLKPAQADDGYYDAVPQGPPANCPPRFCCAHDTSDKRVKGDPVSRDCRDCGITLQSSYKDFQLCPPCSDRNHKCMICGTHAPNANSVEAAAPKPPPPMCPPRFCTQHDSSDKRVKGEAVFRDCRACRVNLQSSYKDFQLCPPCSEKEHSCMICGCSAPKSGDDYMPAAPKGKSGNNGRQANLPPPPPPVPNQDSMSHRQMPQGDALMPNDPTRSMYMSRPAIPNDQVHRGAARQNSQLPEQVFQTQLPSHRGSHGQPPTRAPWEQYDQDQSIRSRADPGDGLAGFLRFVAADIWKTCNNDNMRGGFVSDREQFQGGQFQGGQFQGGQFEGGGQFHGGQFQGEQFQGGQFQGMRRGGA